MFRDAAKPPIPFDSLVSLVSFCFSVAASFTLLQAVATYPVMSFYTTGLVIFSPLALRVETKVPSSVF